LALFFPSLAQFYFRVWQEIKDKKLNGFSVSGYFEEVAAFCREEMFLQQVIEILNNVQD